MRTITPQDVKNTAEEAISNKKKLSTLKHEPFIGVTQSEFIEHLGRQGDWMLQEAPPVQFTPEDINAVASSRFLRKKGLTFILSIVVIVLILRLLTVSVHIIPPLAFYILIVLSGLVFVFFYGKQQRETRNELWKAMEQVGYKRRK